jgi:hypothetical protein
MVKAQTQLIVWPVTNSTNAVIELNCNCGTQLIYKYEYDGTSPASTLWCENCQHEYAVLVSEHSDELGYTITIGVP